MERRGRRVLAMDCVLAAAETHRGRPLNEIVSHHMRDAAELAGFFSAHAVWSLSDGETLVPIYGYAQPESGRAMERLDLPRLEQSVEFGKARLAENPHKAKAAVLIYDGRITLEGRKVDSLIVEFRTFAEEGAAVLAIPYTPKKMFKRFAVHRPKLLEISPKHEGEMSGILEAFFKGVEDHKKGAAVWDKHLDESM